MKREELKNVLGEISAVMDENADYLVSLDARFGDGDLGISMSQGFKKVAQYLETAQEDDLGKLLKNCSSEFNEAAPSTLGTIMSFGFMGMAKVLKGKTEAGLSEMAQAMDAGIQMIMDKAKSRPGDKTILDSLIPGVRILLEKSGEPDVFEQAYQAAYEGMELTKTMKGKHGRIAYYGDKTIGEVDGGATVGMLIFKAISISAQRNL
ncbi:MAG: dihydroxyacetone kinase subunit L [Eubacteriales bacterium]|nr:dihydroxyacetone kinase subunit L [Eubacteriales bacterium]